jgi:hypothetical protein
MEIAPIAEVAFDLSYTEDKMWARIYPPAWDENAQDFACVFEIDEPIGLRKAIFGVGGIQALALSLQAMSACLYGSDLYRRGELGIDGRFGGYLGVPAPKVMLDIAPYPF